MNFAVQFDNPAQANRDLLNSNKSDYIESQETVINGAEGIEFTTLTPDKPIDIPKEGERTPIKLGLRITNNSPKERQFLLALGQPSFLSEDKNSAKIEKECARSGSVLLTMENFSKTLKPGESVDIFDQVFIYQQDRKTIVKYIDTTGLHCNFSMFTLGRYSVTMNYTGIKNLSMNEQMLWKKSVQSTSRNFVLSDH